MKTSLRRVVASLIGLVFVVSGFFKLVDVVGTSLIVEEYFKFFHVEALRPAARLFATLLSFGELSVGFALVSGILRKITASLTFVFLGFFTIVSTLLLIFNPQMECGCFGQIIHLSHLQTFLKNVVLDIMALYAFIPMNSIGRPLPRKIVSFVICEILGVAFLVQTFNQVPLVDNAGYEPSSVIVSESLMDDVENPLFFMVMDRYGNDCSDVILDGKTAVISIYNPSKLSQAQRLHLSDLAASCLMYDINPVVVSTAQIDIPGVDCYLGDYKSIISLNRVNGGVTFLDNGYIIDKHGIGFRPDDSVLERIATSTPEAAYATSSSHQSYVLLSFIAAALLAMLL